MSISSAVLNFFSRHDPKRDAALALARILSRVKVVTLPFDQGIKEGDRLSEEVRVPLGVWLFPITESDSDVRFVPEHGIPAVTCNLRSYGIGVLTLLKLRQTRFLVAIPDQEDQTDKEESGTSVRWLFLDCQARHNTRLPGGWYQLGLQISRLADMDSEDRRRFKEHIRSIEPQAGSDLSAVSAVHRMP